MKMKQCPRLFSSRYHHLLHYPSLTTHFKSITVLEDKGKLKPSKDERENSGCWANLFFVCLLVCFFGVCVCVCVCGRDCCAYGKQKFYDQGLNLSLSSDLTHSNDDGKSLTHWATRDFLDQPLALSHSELWPLSRPLAQATTMPLHLEPKVLVWEILYWIICDQ